KFPENPGQLFRARVIYQLRGGHRLARIHPHFQRAFLLKTEAAPGLIELGRTDAQIKEHSVTTSRRNPVRQFRKIPAPDLEAPGKPRQPALRRLNGVAIVIASKQPSSR